MSQPIRAVYNHGTLRLLDEVHLAEGQEVQLVILSARDRARMALGELLMERPKPDGEEIDEAALIEVIAKGYRGTPLLSETIIAERRTGP